jgi:hypothetical protein
MEDADIFWESIDSGTDSYMIILIKLLNLTNLNNIGDN